MLLLLLLLLLLLSTTLLSFCAPPSPLLFRLSLLPHFSCARPGPPSLPRPAAAFSLPSSLARLTRYLHQSPIVRRTWTNCESRPNQIPRGTTEHISSQVFGCRLCSGETSPDPMPDRNRKAQDVHVVTTCPSLFPYPFYLLPTRHECLFAQSSGALVLSLPPSLPPSSSALLLNWLHCFHYPPFSLSPEGPHGRKHEAASPARSSPPSHFMNRGADARKLHLTMCEERGREGEREREGGRSGERRGRKLDYHVNLSAHSE